MSIWNFVSALNDQSQFTGGILADVLNEDKRLEMITCIVANLPPIIVFNFKFSVYYISPNKLLLFLRIMGLKSYLMAVVQNVN